jgi:hypothetical protein
MEQTKFNHKRKSISSFGKTTFDDSETESSNDEFEKKAKLEDYNEKDSIDDSALIFKNNEFWKDTILSNLKETINVANKEIPLPLSIFQVTDFCDILNQNTWETLLTEDERTHLMVGIIASNFSNFAGISTNRYWGDRN